MGLNALWPFSPWFTTFLPYLGTFATFVLKGFGSDPRWEPKPFFLVPKSSFCKVFPFPQ